MSIGILALVIAAVCAVISLYGAQHPQDRPVRKTDYTSIYKAIAPVEIEI